MHHIHVDNVQGDEGIGYDMDIVHDLMVQLGMKSDFENQGLEQDDTVVPMKDPVNLIGQTNLAKRDMREVDFLTEETDSNIEVTEIVLKVSIQNMTLVMFLWHQLR